MKGYSIRRPPMLETFDMPTRKEMLSVKNGDHVKVMFEDENGGERMWVKVTKREGGEGWEGTLDNVPVVVDMTLGEMVRFHPYDVIDILRA